MSGISGPWTTDESLKVPRPLRFVAYGAAGRLVKAGIIDGPNVMAPRQLAHALLHVDRIVRVEIFDLASGELLLSREENNDVAGP